MLGIAVSIFSLLLGTAMLLLGIGLQGTLLGLRAVHESFPTPIIGYVMSAYFIGFAVGSYLCPPLIRRVGHIRAYAAMAATASAAAIAHALLVDPLSWTLLRIITGTCMVGFYMVIESWLNALAPNNRRGQFLSAYMMITFLAMGASQFLLLAGNIADFTLFAFTTILISAAVVPIVLTRVAQPQLVETPKLHLIVVYRQSPLGVIGTLTAGIVMGAFWGIMPVYGSQMGLDKFGIAWLMSATILGGAILQWPIGKLSDHIDRRSVLGIAAFAAAILAIIGFFVVNGPSQALYTVYFLYGGFAFSLYSLSVAHVNDLLQPEQALDASRGLLQLYGIGAVLGPAAAGFTLKLYGTRTLPLLFGLALLTLALFTLYRMFVRTAPPVEEQEAFIPMTRTSPVSLEMDPRTDTEHGEDGGENTQP